MALGLNEAHPATMAEARRVLDELVQRVSVPTAVNLSWAVRRVRDAAVRATNITNLRRRALDEALAIIEEDRNACRQIGEFGRQELAGKTTLLTRCNTGRLATLGWGTALGVVYAKAAAGEPVKVYACESQPLLQGRD